MCQAPPEGWAQRGGPGSGPALPVQPPPPPCLADPANIEGNAETAQVLGLTPWMDYEFRVIASNILGTGEPSGPSSKIRTKEAGQSLCPKVKSLQAQKLALLQGSPRPRAIRRVPALLTRLQTLTQHETTQARAGHCPAHSPVH